MVTLRLLEGAISGARAHAAKSITERHEHGIADL